MPGSPRLPLLLAIVLAAASFHADATNTPCSGHKGGISRCDGELFLCNDGSISGSKKSCPAYLGVPSGRAAPSVQQFGDTSGECLCGSGSFCTGPRGGVYCLTSDGRKSYVRK
ncbi:hypothetical protein ACA097_00915 [Pseudomonas sp. QL9]|uniref:YdcA family protein n=1 Tax=Pseudomonas TaxID=286 RepID=UPI0013643F38|nr:hypothetical protein [Pseudomonas knackmussii]